MFEASKVGNINEADILKLVLAEIKNEEIVQEKELDDNAVVILIRRQKKKVEDSIAQFTKMERADLISKETEQLKILEKYLPALMSEADIKNVVQKVIADTKASSMREMGMVMGVTMKELDGKADGNTVKNIVQSLLS